VVSIKKAVIGEGVCPATLLSGGNEGSADSNQKVIQIYRVARKKTLGGGGAEFEGHQKLPTSARVMGGEIEEHELMEGSQF